MGRKKNKKKLPSRVKYDRNHRPISFRASGEFYERLQAVRNETGDSYADIMKKGLGLIEVKIRSEKRIQEEALRQGHRKGYELAESTYKLIIPCFGCGEDIVVEDEATKKVIRQGMRQLGWGHSSCVR